MNEERDTWPPQIGQRVWVRPTGTGARVLEVRSDGTVVVELDLEVDRTVNIEELREEWTLDDLRPEYPHRVPEWKGPLE